MIGTVVINGHTYYNVELYPVRSSYDFHMWENDTFIADCVVNGDNWLVKRTNTHKPYVGTTLLRVIPDTAPLALASKMHCVCCKDITSRQANILQRLLIYYHNTQEEYERISREFSLVYCIGENFDNHSLNIEKERLEKRLAGIRFRMSLVTLM
jgi:hypothetical protein